MLGNVASRSLAVVVLVGLAGCSGTGGMARLNPFTWFAAENAETNALEDGAPAAAALPDLVPDGRPLVADVARARLEPTRFGAILRAEGAMEYPLMHSPDLRPVNNARPDADGVIRYDLVATSEAAGRLSLNLALFGEERGERAAALPQARRVAVAAATYVPGGSLDGARAIVIAAESGSVTVPVR